MKKLILYASLISMGMISCSKDYVVPEDELPDWLGESIYEELKNPKSLQGSFSQYLELIDDLGYDDVLSKTGSKTIFPANDDAFNAFFANGNNKYGKSSIKELTTAEKAELLYSSMLDNAILVGNLSTQQNSAGELNQGKIVKHPTNMSLIYSVTPWFSMSMPANNKYYDQFRDGSSILAVYDNTNAPMVHFTGEYMLNNDMTVAGDNSDFYILTGSQYEDGAAYIYNRKVIKSNVTCQNGYIHQLDSVLIPPGNMAQQLRSNSDTKLFSRMLDYYSVPILDKNLTAEYGDWNPAGAGNVYAIRYFSNNSQKSVFNQYDSKSGKIANNQLLNFDPGWNTFNPTVDGSTDDQAEIAAMLIPTDDVVRNYFYTDGKYILENLGSHPGGVYKEIPAGDANNYDLVLKEHLDSVYTHDPSIFASFLNNIMKPYLSKCVPSKFSTVQNDAFEFMNLSVDDLAKKSNGKYDVQITNNGVIYKLNKMYAPEIYNSVLGPASIFTDMRIMGEMLNDHQITAGVASTLEADMYYYLLSMSSRYAVFVPTDNDSFFYVDPATEEDEQGNREALRFYYDASAEGSFHVMVDKWYYKPSTGTFEKIASDAFPRNISDKCFNTQIRDMLDYHTVVLSGTDGLTGNYFYKTKNGGAIYVADGMGNKNAKIEGGLQIDKNESNEACYEASKVTNVYKKGGEEANITNGSVYRLDRPIQPTVKSVYQALSEHSEFTDFLEFCEGFEEDILTEAGISAEDTKKTGKTEQTAYKIFVNDKLRMLGAYNYTLYAPTNEAMQKAHDMGLPTWTQVQEAETAAEKKAMIDVMRDFVFYHIQNSSVFADKTISSNSYQTFCTDALGIAKTLSISGGDGTLNIKDASGSTVSVKFDKTAYENGTSLCNILTRDIETEKAQAAASEGKSGFEYNKITSSSFVVIQGIDQPLCFNSTKSFSKSKKH